MSKICVKSRATNNLVFIPVHLIEEVLTNPIGQTLIRRIGKETIRVYESVDEIQQKINTAYGAKQPTKVIVKETIRHVDRPVVIHQPQRGYRPQSRSDSIVDTAVGIGAGIVLGDVVCDLLDGLFD